MVVVDKSNETVGKESLTKVKAEMKILNSSPSVDDLTEGIKEMTVDPEADLLKHFTYLGLAESSSCKRKEEDVDSDAEDVIVHGDHREDEVQYTSRGPPGVAVESQYYSSQVNDLVTNIQKSRAGAKRPHNQPVDPQSKGFKPQDVPELATRAQNQLSGGSVKCQNRPVKQPTVRVLLAEKEQRQEQLRQQQMYMLLHQSQMGGTVQQTQVQPPVVSNQMNIPPDPLVTNDDDTEGIPSFDVDAILKVVTESESITTEFSDQVLAMQNNVQPQVVPSAPQTQLPPAAIRRVRNQPSMSDSSVSDPRSPESGYLTSSSAPNSPKSESSRPSSFDEDQKLAPELEAQLSLVCEYINEKEAKRKEKEQDSQPQQPSCQYVQDGQATKIAAAPAAGMQSFMTVAPQTSQPAPVQYPVNNMCAGVQPNQPVVVSFVGAPNVVPRQPCPPTTSGKGRPPNSKGHQHNVNYLRPILPKPTQQPPIQIIPTTVTGQQTCVQATLPVNVTSAPKPLNQSVPPQLQMAIRSEPTKYPPIAPKNMQQRGQDIMKKYCEFIDEQELCDIIKPDSEGDLWLHSYIMYLNENQDVVYMINAIISRLKREHKESNINIKQVINTQNHNYQTPVYLATVMNNQYVLDWLLKAGGDPNIVASSNTPSGTVRKGPLHYAASRGDECLDVLYVLLECRDTDLNLKNTDGLSPLHVAVQSHGKPIPNSTHLINSTRVIEALITKGANLDEVDDKNGKTPIHNLVETQCHELISAIFNVIPEPDLKKYLRKQDYQGNTALHAAAQSAMSNIDDHKKIIKLLLEKGADPSMKNAENQTASQLTYKLHREELAPLLKASHGKSMHNAGSSTCNAWSPNSQPSIKPAPKKPTATAINANTAPTYIVVQTVPAATTQMVTLQGLKQPVQSQVPIVTIPQNTMLTTQPMLPCGNQTLTQMQSQVVSQNCYTSPINSPQMYSIGSPQVAQSPPQVRSPEMSQANHDISLGSPSGPTSPPQQGTTYVNPQQTNVNQVYQLNNVIH